LSEGQIIGGAYGPGGPAGTGSQARAAIARAAQATGVDFQYLLAQAKLESSLDPKAHAATSSAAGLYQFTSGTWLETLGRHGASHGMAWVQDAIAGGRMSDPGLRAQVMGLRYDADASALMAAELASDNRDQLTTQLGREPDATELYIAHFLGAAGAGQFLSALATDPGQSAAALLPKAAAANRGIFYAGGAPRSVGGVMDLMRAKVAGAMEGGNAGDWAGVSSSQWAGQNWASAATGPQIAYETAGLEAEAGWQPQMGPLAREFHGGLAAARGGGQIAAVTLQAPARSMAETLQGAFGTVGEAVPGHVRDAYAKLARFNL
jgi:hypothetical protein